MKMYCTCILLSAIVLMHLVDVVISVGSSTRYYANGTSVTCQGVICPLDKIFVPCTHSMGDGRHDTCELCPSDKPRTLDTFDSSAFEDPPDVCKSVLERCTCAEEAELVNPEECAKTLLPNCSCNITAGYYGPDPKACQLSENKQCKLPGYELKQDGSCHECSGDTYKNTHQFGRCLPQPRCYPSLVVDDPGDKAHRRTCKTPVTLPPPDRSTSTESTSTAIGINNPTLSNPTSNVAASTNQTNPLLDSTNLEWIYMYLVPVVAVVLLIVGVLICVIRKKKRKRKKWQQDKRHQTKSEDYDGLENENNNLMHSVNSHQQDNSGDCHKSSRVFKMFKRKFCTKTCGSSKGYVQVKIKTKNEEKNTVDGDQTPAKVIGNQTSDIVYVDEIKEKVNSNGITEIADNMDIYGTFIEMHGDETVEEVNGDDTSENVNDDETVENVNDDETAEKMNGGETAEKVNGGETAEKVNGGETAEKVNDETAEKVYGDETAEKVNGGETAEKVNGGETAEKVNGGETAEKVNGGETAEKVNGGETAEKVNGDETAEKVNGGETAEKVNIDDETAEKVTKIESCENTTTNPCATENHETSYINLDVNSLISSGKMSSGFVDDMYILRWSSMDHSSSNGFIECTDPSGNQFKSMTINNGNQGRILLKMKDIGKRYKFIFVSSSENGQIESFVEVIVEPVTRTSDLSSLLKSGLSTLDFSSFKVVQNRPEENLSFPRHQDGSLDQPHHMPLLHSQRQADSGISDTTPAECGSQAGNSSPCLSLSSFNQDFDNDGNYNRSAAE